MIEVIFSIGLCIASIISIGYGLFDINANIEDIQFKQSIQMTRDTDLEDYSEDNTICDVTYINGDKQLIVSYSYEDYVKLDDKTITAYEYETKNGTKLYFDHQNINDQEVQYAYKQVRANELASLFNFGIASLILMLSILIMMLFAKQFTTYEKSWFISIMVLATIFSVVFPEESANGVNGIIIMLLYLLDTFLNILCELLISKQSRYNFLVSILVEIVEIAICVVLMYRFATMATTLFFWLPIDIISYINWSKHKDDEENELTVVRKLRGYQEVLVIIGIIVWTFVIGYLISGLNIATDFYNNELLETFIIYIDACASAVGIANGLFIFFRLQEQWIAWYICAFLEAVINIISGQYVLLVLKLGYFTNTTYGYIKWSRYIKEHTTEKQSQIS
ncbi:nicotinamide riboside transporter PnuC [Erysipelatoclostridium ramosum]|nr:MULTISPECIES: nicotinamide riboside transporter PnuC [Thomasclavelia]MCB5414468.1 nicotinamide riboside transporter PnuC [Thomasclavelia ramosa]MCB5418067.1 nicotinamide riboside transporter PnuC [Thomasclavelia ramosa]MCB5437282.1 nicotinamide riboside transporter PnuC [Thomasclavelia ramosa]MCB5472382.1 nicotinamide riboside transporter PnuC [Thomasclavelia ramosa]MCB5498312.1 nicotinamide riboside transporter PnuC [Thomasclavelia ramosa]